MKNAKIAILLAAACMLIFSACSAKPTVSKAGSSASPAQSDSLSADPSQPDTLALPDRIVYYNQGSEQAFKKGDPVYVKLYTLTQKRITKDLDESMGVFPPSSNYCGMLRILKFEYSAKQTIHPKGKDLLPEAYQTLYFPLECTPDEPMLSRYMLDDVDHSQKVLVDLDDPALTLQYVILNLDPTNSSSAATTAGEAVSIPKPDGIVYYDHGKSYRVKPGDKLFDQVFWVATNRFKSVTGLRKADARAPAAASLESGSRVLEFNYNSSQKLTVSGTETGFKKLVFPLEKFDSTDLTNDFLYDDSTSPIAFISSPDELNYFLKESFQ